MKRTHSEKADDLIAKTTTHLAEGAEIKKLCELTGMVKSTILRLVRDAEERGALFSTSTGNSRGNGRIYFLTIGAMRAYRPVVRVHKVSKPAMPDDGRRGARAKFKNKDAYRPKSVKTQYCPAGIDSRYTPVEPFPKIWSALPIGVYL